MPSSPISAIRSCSADRAGRRWPAGRANAARAVGQHQHQGSRATRDVLYVEELIGPDTVNTIPPATFDAFRDHGKPQASLEADLDAAHDVMETLEAGRNLDEESHR